MSKKLITFYKSQCIDVIAKHTNLSVRVIDKKIKTLAKIEKSCLEMTTDELNELIVTAFEYGDTLGLHINFPDNEADFIKDIFEA